MKIALLALTGFGNPVLDALCTAGLAPALVVTRQEAGAYPYHPARDIADIARDRRLPVLFSEAGELAVAAERWDMVIIATYHRIVSDAVLQASPWPINLHPSLLPRWRGPAPVFAALDHGDSTTGVTAVRMTGGIDDGPILVQRSIDIAVEDDQGSLRRRLAELSGAVVRELARDVASGTVMPREQDSELATWAPRPDEAMRLLEVCTSVDALLRRIRALHPWPRATWSGAKVEWGTAVRPASVGGSAPDEPVAVEGSRVTVRLRDGEVVLHLTDRSD